MARLITDGAETGAYDAPFITKNGYSTINSTAGFNRSGNYSYKSNGDTVVFPNDLSEFYFRAALYFSTDSTLFFFRIRNGATTICYNSYNNTSKQISSNLGGTARFFPNIATGFHLFEVYFKADSVNGKHILRVDGVVYAEFTGNTGTTPANSISFNDAGVYVYTDDIALNDTNGAIDNSWCGDGKIIALVPNGDSSVQWLGSDGDTTNNYALVDELPPSDSDYVRATGSAYTDIYNLSDYDFAGQTIQRLWMVSRAKSSVSNDYFLHGIQVSGSNYLVTGSLPTTFGRIDIAATGTWNKNPFTNDTWTQEQLDSLLLVIKSP